MDDAKRDIERCRLFLYRKNADQPVRRIREIQKEARRIVDAPKLYPVESVHPVSGLEFRRKNVGNFSIIYAYLEPTSLLPKGEVSIRAIRHGAEEDVLYQVEESRSSPGGGFPRLRTGHNDGALLPAQRWLFDLR